MKKSYKIIGLYLDGIRTKEKEIISGLENSDLYSNVFEQRNIFSLSLNVASIEDSALLKLNSINEIIELINKLDKDEKLCILMKYHCDSPIVRSFYYKRLFQIISVIELIKPTQEIVLTKK